MSKSKGVRQHNEEIYFLADKLRNSGWSWQQIANYFGRHRNNMRVSVLAWRAKRENNQNELCGSGEPKTTGKRVGV